MLEGEAVRADRLNVGWHNVPGVKALVSRGSVSPFSEGQVPISRGSAGASPRRGVTPANVVGTWVDPHCASGLWCRIVVLVSCCGSSFQCRAGRRSARCCFLGKSARNVGIALRFCYICGGGDVGVGTC